MESHFAYQRRSIFRLKMSSMYINTQIKRRWFHKKLLFIFDYFRRQSKQCFQSDLSAETHLVHKFATNC